LTMLDQISGGRFGFGRGIFQDDLEGSGQKDACIFSSKY